MTSSAWALLLGLCLSAPFLPAECVQDYRSNKNAGIVISDFSITGTQTISATELARIIGDVIGACFDENSDAMEERVRALFQQHGYFSAEVKSLSFKARDPLGVPKPVTLESEVADGPRYRLSDVKFVDNHAFAAEELRQQFSLKRGEVVERDKVASGLESLRQTYAARGYLDMVSIPETELASNATMSLTISIEEGPQYHMGELAILAPKEATARLRAEWKLAEGDVYDVTYIDQFVEANRSLLPAAFSSANIQTFRNCPDARIQVRLILDPEQEESQPQPKHIPCEEEQGASKSPEKSPK